MQNSLRVGVDAVATPNYHLTHNCVIPGVDIVRAPGLPFGKVAGPLRNLRKATYVPAFPTRYDLLHLWNKVRIVGRGPWGTTFESRMPRVPDDDEATARRLIAQLAQDSECRFLIGMSEYARSRMIGRLPKEARAALIDRIHVVYPSVRAPTVRQPMTLADSDELEIVFVGRDFFRKGGEAVLRVVERLANELNLHATIVSPVASTDYATQSLSESHVETVRSRLERAERLTWLRSTAHSEVLALMRQAAVVALPTLADTFGYSIAEGAISGAASFGSSVQAIPEIVGDKNRVVSLPMDESGEWTGVRGSLQDYLDAVDLLESGLGDYLRRCRNTPDQLTRDREASRQRAVAMFGDSRDARLREIYRGALEPNHHNLSGQK